MSECNAIPKTNHCERFSRTTCAILPQALAFCLMVVTTCLYGRADTPVQAPLRIATFNIRCPVDKSPNSWEERAPKCRALIKKHHFDLLGLQEATWKQMEDLLQMDGWAFTGGCRIDGKRKGEASCIFYRKERFELLDSDTFWLSETPETPGSKSWNTACPRICTWAKLKDRKNDSVFYYYNTHLDHKSSEARIRGARLIMERITRCTQGYPVFFSGDLNTYPDTEPYNIVTACLKDSFTLSQTPHTGPTKTYQAFKYNEHHEGKPIDFIFVSDGIDVLTHKTLDDSDNQLYPSDHLPVATEARLR